MAISFVSGLREKKTNSKGGSLVTLRAVHRYRSSGGKRKTPASDISMGGYQFSFPKLRKIMKYEDNKYISKKLSTKLLYL